MVGCNLKILSKNNTISQLNRGQKARPRVPLAKGK